MTELDQLLEQVRKNPAEGHLFYDAFLNKDLFIPVKCKDREPQGRKLEPHEQFFPLFIKKEEKKIVPVFETLERLDGWAADDRMDYIELKGHVLIGLLDPKIEVILNIGTQYSHLFAEFDLARLRQAMKPMESPSTH